MTLKPIGLDTQIEDCLFGQSEQDKEAVREKIADVTARIDLVDKINGHKVYNPVVNGDDIWYNLQKCPKEFEQKILSRPERCYYYPIQYAKIEFNEKNNQQSKS